MKVVIIGTGNVAEVLAKLIVQQHELLMFTGRNEERLQQLAEKFNTGYTTSYKNINQDADIYILSVSDHAVEEVITKIIIPKDKIIVHTTGSVSINALKFLSDNYGVLYPLQSIRKDTEKIPEIPFFIDANNSTTKNIIKAFAKTLSPLVSEADDEQRIKLHIAAVFVSNFANYLYTAANDFCEKENIPFHYLTPLMKETVGRLQNQKPENVMTGPAVRKDENTIQKHLQLLQSHPEIKEVYEFLTEKIQERFS